MKTDPGFSTTDGDRSWICSVHGNKIHPFDLRFDEIDIEDIAVTLSRMPRFFGKTKGPAYSVAEHCVRASLQVHPGNSLVMLMHDCEEGIFGDMARPIKHHPKMQWFRDLCETTRAKIMVHFGLDPELPEWVHEVDNRMLATEKRDLLAKNGNAVWSCNAEPYPFVIRPWSERKAFMEFMLAFQLLTDMRSREVSVANRGVSGA